MSFAFFFFGEFKLKNCFVNVLKKKKVRYFLNKNEIEKKNDKGVVYVCVRQALL